MQTVLTEKWKEIGRKRIAPFPVDGFIPGQGPIKPKLLLIGEAPGETEVEKGRPFTGRAGIELDKCFELAGMTREEAYMTSTVRSRPYRYGEKLDRKTGERVQRKYNRKPTNQEILAHAPLLDFEIEQVQAPLILVVGNVALERLIGKSHQVSKEHGMLYTGPVKKLENLKSSRFIWTKQEYRLFITFHPAAVFYNPKLRSSMEADYRHLKTLLEQ